MEAWLPDKTLQNIALENNLSETAFFIRKDDRYHLRWFTPGTEVGLCGHATLASAFVIFNFLDPSADKVVFDSLSGPLTVQKNPEGMTLDFPVWDFTPIPTPYELTKALGKAPRAVYSGHDWIAVYDDAKTVENLAPNMAALNNFEAARGIIATARGTGDIDFVSRWFGPRVGVDEDPVTGSAHCILTPFWADQMKKTKFKARQISKRGGDLICELKGRRVEITGNAVLYLKGEISV